MEKLLIPAVVVVVVLFLAVLGWVKALRRPPQA